MTVLEFLSHLRAKDIKLWIEGEKLRFRAPDRVMTPEIRAEIAARKAEILQFLRQFRDEFHDAMPPIRPVSRQQPLPLSFSQQRLWFLDQLDPSVPIYNMYDSAGLWKQINIQALQNSFTELVRRHEILRTTFQSVAGVPVQVIAPPSTFPLPIIDLSSLSAEDQEQETSRLKKEDSRWPFDLAEGPLLAAKLLKYHDEHYLLLLAFHHIVMDDWSRKIFYQEMDALYTAFSRGLPSPLPDLTIQYADFAVWQREWLQGKVLESYLDYWGEQLKGDLPSLDLPTDRPRCQSSRGAEGKFVFSRSLTQSIKEFSDREGVTPFMTLAAVYGMLLFRYTGREDIIIGSPIADRNQPETKDLIGFFLNSLALRMNFSGDPPFRKFLKQVREVCLGAHAHQEVPYEPLLQRLHLTRNLSGSPIFQTMFVLLNTPNVSNSSKGLWETEEERFARDGAPPVNGRPFAATRNNGTAKFDLSFVLVEENQVIYGITEYNADFFDHNTIARLVERFEILLESAIKNPEARISELPLMTEAERRKLLAEWSGHEEVFSGGPGVHQLFEAQAERTPDAIAVEFQGERRTYAELNSRANQWARYLQKLGAGPEVMVGIFLERSPEMLAAQLGTLKTGATYVPLDPSYPEKRLALILDDVQVGILVTREFLAAKLPGLAAPIVCIDRELEKIAAESGEKVPCQVSEDGRVCVLYTSGSTGRPKGVMITQRALLNNTMSAIRDYGLVQSDRVLQFASMSFDTSLEEVYPCLARGATLVLRAEEMLDSFSTFLRCCREQKLTLLDLPTAYWHEIVAQLEKEEMPASVRLVILGGEKALPDKVAAWQKLVGERVVLVNTYGPTEGTIVVTRCNLPGIAAAELAGKEVAIGRPIENTKIYVLDPWMQPAPIGIPGELYIGGVALARGYLNRPDLTAERFIADPLSDKPGSRLYRTGDLVRFLPDGNLQYCGRTDHQVKIRGYRIEPGEIEAVLKKHESVKDAVLLVREDHPGIKQLIAYIVLRETAAMVESEVRNFLKPRLPDYMLPSACIFLPMLPLTANGKIDYRALPKPDSSRPHLKGEMARPRTPTEEALLSIWIEILKLDRIGIDENFFDLGGHSLLATQVVSRISDAFQIDMPLRRLFELPTIAELSAAVDQMVQAGSPGKLRIVSIRELMIDSLFPKETQAGNGTVASEFPGEKHMSVAGPDLEHMLAGLEGLSEQEVEALLGEKKQP
jgi:amino acid adenylation domain-containing protein